MNDPLEMTAAYLEGKLNSDQVAELETYLREDPARAKAFVRQAMLDSHLTELLHEQNIHDVATDLSDDSQFGALLQALDAPEGAGGPIDFTEVIKRGRQKPATVIATSLSGKDLVAVGSYVLRKALTRNPAIYAGITSAAAVLLLTLILINPFASNRPEPIVEQFWDDNTVQEPVEVSAAVAKLTATYEAQWSTPGGIAAPQVGESLRAGQSLALIDGFVEVTTEVGAVVTLEAPCTFDLIDRGNVLNLQAGKLVAMVPPGAVGFTVHTPTARVIDYGTQFGVEVREDGATHTAVFTGEVELSELPVSGDQPARNIRLTQGWASLVSRKGVLQRSPKPTTAQDLSRYAKSIDEVIDPGFAYRRAVLASKPLVYWGFDEGQDTTDNLAGNIDYDGKAIGQTAHGKGLFGWALQLTGQIDSMGGFASDTPLSLKESQSYTLEAWCWLDRPHQGRVLTLAELEADMSSLPKHLGMIEVLEGGTKANIGNPENESVRFLHRYPPSSGSTEGENYYSDRGAPTGQWVHLVAVKDRQEIRIYMNGRRVAQASDQQRVATDRPLGLYVGISPIMLRPNLSERPSDFRLFAGRIDEIAVYDTALSENTIQQHFSLGQAGLDQ